jgi:hypothetical protein
MLVWWLPMVPQFMPLPLSEGQKWCWTNWEREILLNQQGEPIWVQTIQIWTGGGDKGEGFFLLKYIHAMQLQLLTCALISHVSNQFYPIWFAQSSPFVTYISRPKGSHFIFSWKVYFVEDHVSGFFFMIGQSKWLIAWKNKKAWETPI